LLVLAQLWQKLLDCLNTRLPHDITNVQDVHILIVDETVCYLANSIARVSRITLTLMVPGYCMVLSILVAMSRASLMALKSSMSCGLTKMRTSRPALMA